MITQIKAQLEYLKEHTSDDIKIAEIDSLLLEAGMLGEEVEELREKVQALITDATPTGSQN